MTKAVIFDLEGTLLTTRECRIRAWSQTAREQGIQCDETLLHRMAHARAPQALEIMLTRSHRLYQPAEKLALLARREICWKRRLNSTRMSCCCPRALLPYRRIRRRAARCGC